MAIRKATSGEMDAAQQWITYHHKNIQSWDTHGCSTMGFGDSQFSREYSEERLAFWTRVLLTGEVGE